MTRIRVDIYVECDASDCGKHCQFLEFSCDEWAICWLPGFSLPLLAPSANGGFERCDACKAAEVKDG